MLRIETILCPIDFSTASLRAADYAISLARNYAATLRLLYVMGQPPAADLWDDLAKKASLAGVAIKTEVRTGNIAEQICEALETTKPGLLVMGTHGRHGFEKLFLGSVTERVLRRIPVPVLTVAGSKAQDDVAPPAIRRILIAVDFSEGSASAVSYGLSIAQECQAHVTLLHVADDLFAVDAAGHHYEDIIAKQIRNRLEKLVPAGVRDWCTVDTHVAVGIPSDVILATIESRHIDLVVMNLHSKRMLERIFLGSSAESIVRAAPCPVLLIPGVTSATPLVAESQAPEVHR